MSADHEGGWLVAGWFVAASTGGSPSSRWRYSRSSAFRSADAAAPFLRLSHARYLMGGSWIKSLHFKLPFLFCFASQFCIALLVCTKTVQILWSSKWGHRPRRVLVDKRWELAEPSIFSSLTERLASAWLFCRLQRERPFFASSLEILLCSCWHCWRG